jgi:hypothetical protein
MRPPRPRDILIDTQLLVLLVVGLASQDFISKHKRLQNYSIYDFEALKELIAPPVRLVLIPNVLSEASNFLGHLAEPLRTKTFDVFRALIESENEIYVPSKIAVGLPIFVRLGLADAACLAADLGNAALLTDDNDLYLAALHSDRPALNFRYLREAAG